MGTFGLDCAVDMTTGRITAYTAARQAVGTANAAIKRMLRLGRRRQQSGRSPGKPGQISPGLFHRDGKPMKSFRRA